MKKIIMLGIITAIILSTVGCKSSDTNETTTKASATEEAKQTVEAFGVVKGTDIKNITLDFNAIVDKVLVKEGQKVKTADVLVTMDINDYLAEIAGKEQELAAAKLDLQREKVDINQLNKELQTKSNYLKENTDPDIQKLINELAYAQESYETAMDELATKQKLLNVNAISQDEYNQFKKSVDNKKQAVDEIKHSLNSTKYQKQKEIDQLQASVDKKTTSAQGTDSIKLLTDKITTLENSLKLIKNKLNRSYIQQNNIIADVSNGVVYDIGYDPGDIISQQKKVLSILNLDSIVIEADVSEEYVQDVKVDASVTIVPQSDKSKKYTGKVISISNKAVQKNGETIIPVRISIDNGDGYLMPEFNVDVSISVAEK